MEGVPETKIVLRLPTEVDRRLVEGDWCGTMVKDITNDMGEIPYLSGVIERGARVFSTEEGVVVLHTEESLEITNFIFKG